MAKLSIRSGGGSWPLDQQAITIGRRPDNPIVVADSFASGRHAMVGWDGARYYIEDLKSSNGTLLNGKPVTRAPLKFGDIIRIGTQEILFEDDMPEMGTLIMSGPLTAQPSATPPPVTPVAPAPEPVALQVEIPARVASPAPPMPVQPAFPDLLKIAETLPPPKPAPADEKPASMLDELVGSIRSHRDREQQEKQEAEARVRSEWDKTLTLAEELKAKTADDARLKRFIVDRRAQDVMIQLQRTPTSPMLFITVSLRHPDQKSTALSGIWLRRTGEPDRCLANAQLVGTELIRDLAFLLA